MFQDIFNVVGLGYDTYVKELMTQADTSNESTQPTRDQTWVSATGLVDGDVIHAHKGGRIEYIAFDPPQGHPLSDHPLLDLEARLDNERFMLSPSATSSRPGDHAYESLPGIKAGNTPYPTTHFRTRFEHDRDSIRYSEPFRRLAGKTQVHLNRDDHQRTRLTHALEVAQVASEISKSLRLNVVLTEAIALGHDCGHGPGGHASEDAFDPYLPGGFNHATFGANVTLRDLDLCDETLDGIRNHSWSLNLPQTPEGEVVSFADRIAYVCHDLEDALSCGMITRRDFPRGELASFLNRSRAEQIDTFIRGVIQGTLESGSLAIMKEQGELLGEMRVFNTERIYKSPQSVEQNDLVIATLSELVDYLVHATDKLPESYRNSIDEGRSEVEAVVEYVAGMTDDYAYRLHAELVKGQPLHEHGTLHLM